MPKELTFTPLAEEANKGYKHLVEYCLELAGNIEDSAYRKKTIEEIKESIEAYDQVEKPTTDPWEGASAIQLPLTTISCDNLEPRIVSGLIGKKPYVAFEMENNQQKDEPTEILESWFNEELQDVVGIETFAGSLVNQLLKEGTVYPIPEYSLQEETVRDYVFFDEVMAEIQKQVGPKVQEAQQAAQMVAQIDPQQAQMIMAGVQQEIEAMKPPQIGGVVVDPQTGDPQTKDTKTVLFEGGKAELIPFTDILIPDNIDDWESAPIIRRIRPTYAEILRDAENKKGFIRKNIGPWLCDQEGSYELSQDEQSPIQSVDGVKVQSKKTIPCFECYVSYIQRKDDIEDEKELKSYDEQRVVVQIAEESKIVLRVIPLVELNFKNEHLIKRIRLFPRNGKSYGTSIYQKIKSIQKGASNTFNTAINVAEVTMIPWFLFTESTGLGKYRDGIKLSAGKGIPVDDINGLYFPKFSINPDQILKWIDLWVSFWERLISIGDLQVGRSGSKDTTATETMAVIQEGNIKHNYQSVSIRADFLCLVRTIYDLYYQHMPLDKTFLWNGKKVPVSRSVMRRKLNFRLTGSTDSSNKLIERKEKETFYALTQNDLSINPVKKAEELVKAYGHTDTTEWVSPNIKGMVEMIMKTPGAEQLVMKAIQEAKQIAAQVTGNPGQPQQGAA
uniref:Putative structural protein n=1 Tax=viral metagenome TaxID=1070528 RepID=A0A6H1ZEU6_9ZZZZ